MFRFLSRAIVMLMVISFVGASYSETPSHSPYDGLLYDNNDPDNWLDNGQTKYPKYSGAAATAFSVNRPQAIYDHISNKTFFVYSVGNKDGRVPPMHYYVGCFDHNKGNLCLGKPEHITKRFVIDGHDNAAILIDSQGYLWVYISARSTRCDTENRCAEVYKSLNVRDNSSFAKEVMGTKVNRNAAYIQPWNTSKGPVVLFTYYNNDHREIWIRKAKGTEHKLVSGGHYYVSYSDGKDLILVAYSSFSNHKDPDTRKDIYFIYSDNSGDTWKTYSCWKKTTHNCQEFSIPAYGRIVSHDESAKVWDTGDHLTYVQDIKLSNHLTDPKPYILYIKSSTHYTNDPAANRTLRLGMIQKSEDNFLWSVSDQNKYKVTHNYSSGYVESNGNVIFPFSSYGSLENSNFNGGDLFRFNYKQPHWDYSDVTHFVSDGLYHNHVKDVYNTCHNLRKLNDDSAYKNCMDYKKKFSFFWSDNARPYQKGSKWYSVSSGSDINYIGTNAINSGVMNQHKTLQGGTCNSKCQKCN